MKNKLIDSYWRGLTKSLLVTINFYLGKPSVNENQESTKIL